MIRTDRPTYFIGIEVYIRLAYSYMCPVFTYTNCGDGKHAIHVVGYGGTQSTTITQEEIEVLSTPWPDYINTRIGTMNWQHVSRIMDTIPCVNRDWITKVRNTTEVGRNITKIRDAKALHNDQTEE